MISTSFITSGNLFSCQHSSGAQQNLKEVPQNFTEVFNVDDVTANDVIQRNQHRIEKKINLSSTVITDVKLASQLRKDSEFCFSFLWQEHCHSKIHGSWLCKYVTSLYYILIKSSRRIFSQHLPFQSMNSNTKVEVGCERYSRLIKKTLVSRKSIVAVHFVRFEQNLHLVSVLLWPFSKSN